MLEMQRDDCVDETAQCARMLAVCDRLSMLPSASIRGLTYVLYKVAA